MLIILIEKMSTLQHADWQKHTLPFLLTPMDGQSVSQSVSQLAVEPPRRALCLSTEAPDTTVTGPGPSQWPSTQRPTLRQWGRAHSGGEQLS